MAKRTSTQQFLAYRPASLISALLVCLMETAHAASTTLTLADTLKGSSSTPVTMQFPVTRSGDLSYGAVLNYYTVDGSAYAGTDYSAASGTVIIPAGAASVTVPVTLSANTSAGPNITFSLQTSGATGIGPAPSFSAQQIFATGAVPAAVANADLNGNGRADLVIANYSDDTVSVLFNTTPPGAATSTFAAQQTFATGNGPRSVATADINGDGKIDLIVTSSDDTISVLLNTTIAGAATPSFAAAQTFNAFGFGQAPTSVTTADMNGDGKLDLIVSNFCCDFNSTVAVLLNTTDAGAISPSFATAQVFDVGSDGRSVFVGDVNGDGSPDLAVVSQIDNTVSVLLSTTAPGTTTVTFATPQAFSTGSAPTCVALADINGDGKLDLIVTNHSGDNVSTRINTTTPGASTPSFDAQQTFVTGIAGFGSARFVRVGDTNGDGKPDLIVVNELSNNVSVLLNITVPGGANANFATQQMFTTGPFPLSVALVDLNGDGKVDLVATNSQDNTISVLLNTTAAPTATLNFAAVQAFAGGAGPESVTAADINADGRTDLIVPNVYDNTVSVLLNETAPGAATPTFAAQQTFPTGSAPNAVAVTDVNGDGKPDLIAVNVNSHTVSVLLNTTVPGVATLSFATQQTFATGSAPLFITAADINGDGRPDLITSNENDSTVSVLLNTTAPGATTPSFSTQQVFATGFGSMSVATADLNGDGRPDLAVPNYGANTVSVLLNTTAPGAATPSFAPLQAFATGLSPQSVAIADINGDGKPDLIIANVNGGNVSVLLNATAPGAITPSFTGAGGFGTGSGPLSVTPADLDGDGKPDLIVANSGGSISIGINTTAPGAATLSFTAYQVVVSGSGLTYATTADLNGDGKPDLIAADFADNAIKVLLNTQYQAIVAGSPAIGTIVHDYIFANGFE